MLVSFSALAASIGPTRAPSLVNVNATGTGSAVAFTAPISSVNVWLAYTGTGGEVDIEGSTDGTHFTVDAKLLLTEPGGQLVKIYFDHPRHISPDPSRGPHSRDPLVSGVTPTTVRANLVSLNGASDVSVDIGMP